MNARKGARVVQRATHDDGVKLDRHWRPALMGYFLRRVRNHAEAEDLTQEVFARALGANDAHAPDAYVFQIAANLLTDRARAAGVRTRYREQLAKEEVDPVETLDPFRIAAGRAELAHIVEGLMELPERTRTIFVLYRIENMRQDVIAQSFGITTSAVKKQVAKAMAHLLDRAEQTA